MKQKNLVLLIVVLICVACGKKATQEHGELAVLCEAMTEMSYNDISIAKVDSLLGAYERQGDVEHVAVCRLVKGAKLYALNRYADALGELKRAEQYVEGDDAESGRLYYYLSRIFAVDNPAQSDYYARRLLVWAEENEDATMMALGNKMLMNIAEAMDSAEYYRAEAVKWFEQEGDTLMVEKCNARFGIKFVYDLPFDSVVRLILPFYERVGYARDADALATVCLLNEDADAALPYMEKLRGVNGFEYQYYNNMAVYYSQKEAYEQALMMYDSAFVIYQEQAKTLFEEQIARVNGEFDKKLYNKQIELQRYKTMFIVLMLTVLILAGVALVVWLVRILRYHKKRSKELKVEKEKLEEENVELIDTTNKQLKKLYAVSDICKNTYASVVLAHPDMVKVIGKSLYESLREVYPQLSNMDFTYMFLDFIGLSVSDICRVLSVQEGTYYCRRSAIKKKLASDTEQGIDEIFEQFFLGKFIE